MTAKSASDGLTIEVRKTAQGDHYEFGVTYEGVWVPIHGVNAPELDAQVTEAKSEHE